MNDAETAVLESSRTRLRWLADYHGKAGYQRMYDELTGSYFKDFPELVGRVGVFNFATDPAEETARLRAELNLPPTSLKYLTSQEQTSHLALTQGAQSIPERSRAIAWGLNPATYTADIDTLTPQQINNLAWQMTHEMFHAADDILNRYSPASVAFENAENHARWVDSLADGGRINLYTRNYGSYPDYMNVLKNYIVNLDATRPYAPYHSEEIARDPDDLENFIVHSAPERYDNGELLAQMLRAAPLERQNTSYTMHGWRKSFDQVTFARDTWSAARIGNLQLETVTTIILADAATHYKAIALKDLEPIATQISETYGQSASDLVEGLFGSPELYRLVRAKRGPLADELGETIMRQLSAFLDWVRDRPTFIPSAGRLLAAHDFLAKHTDEVGLYKTVPITDVQGVVRAAAQFRDTNDPLDRNAAELYTQTPGGMPVIQKKRLLALYFAEPDLAHDMERLPSVRA